MSDYLEDTCEGWRVTQRWLEADLEHAQALYKICRGTGRVEFKFAAGDAWLGFQCGGFVDEHLVLDWEVLFEGETSLETLEGAVDELTEVLRGKLAAIEEMIAAL